MHGGREEKRTSVREKAGRRGKQSIEKIELVSLSFGEIKTDESSPDGQEKVHSAHLRPVAQVRRATADRVGDAAQCAAETRCRTTAAEAANTASCRIAVTRVGGFLWREEERRTDETDGNTHVAKRGGVIGCCEDTMTRLAEPGITTTVRSSTAAVTVDG